MTIKRIFIAMLLVVFAKTTAQENTATYNGNRPDGHAPISVMGDHTHSKGGWMLSYRYMSMNMEDLKRGSDNVSFSNALEDFMVTPTQMTMEMHMLGLMYAPTDKLTLMAMTNYTIKDMDHLTRMGGTFSTSARGIGDTKISGLYTFYKSKRKKFHANLGFSIPTGSIDEMDVTPASNGIPVILPYPMQIGFGTFNAEGGGTFLWQTNSFSGGNQLLAVIPLGTNDNGYSFGNTYSLNNWVAYKASEALSFSARVKGQTMGEIDGVDPRLIPTMVTTADTANSGGSTIDGGLGLNLYVPNGPFKNLRFSAELSYALYQNLNGVQLRTKETFTGGVQYAF